LFCNNTLFFSNAGEEGEEEKIDGDDDKLIKY